MKTSNQASQPAGSDRDSMGEHESQPISFFTGRPIDPAYSATCPCCGAAVIPGEKCLSCGELAPQASIALHPSLTPEMPAGFASEPVEHPKSAREWLQDALGRYQVTHIHSSIREALKVMDITENQPVEQGEQTLDKDCKCCGYPCRGFLCDYCFRERLMDSFHQCKTKPSTTAPSQPELGRGNVCRRCGFGVVENGRNCLVCISVPDHTANLMSQAAAKITELQQQLAQKVEELQNDLVLSGHERNILKNSLVQCGCKQDPQCPDQWYNSRAEKAEQQLVQIRETEVSVHSNPLAALKDLLTVNAALRLDNAQKDKRIAELESGTS